MILVRKDGEDCNEDNQLIDIDDDGDNEIDSPSMFKIIVANSIKEESKKPIGPLNIQMKKTTEIKDKNESPILHYKELLKGEDSLIEWELKCGVGKNFCKGKLIITTYQLVFECKSKSFCKRNFITPDYFVVPHGMIAKYFT